MTDKQQNLCRLAALLLMATSLSGCNTWSRLTSIGKEPELAPIQNPVDAPGYQAVSMPMPGEAGTICRGQFFVEERFFGIFPRPAGRQSGRYYHG